MHHQHRHATRLQSVNPALKNAHIKFTYARHCTPKLATVTRARPRKSQYYTYDCTCNTITPHPQLYLTRISAGILTSPSSCKRKPNVSLPDAVLHKAKVVCDPQRDFHSVVFRLSEEYPPRVSGHEVSRIFNRAVCPEASAHGSVQEFRLTFPALVMVVEPSNNSWGDQSLDHLSWPAIFPKRGGVWQ